MTLKGFTFTYDTVADHEGHYVSLIAVAPDGRTCYVSACEAPSPQLLDRLVAKVGAAYRAGKFKGGVRHV